MALGSAAVLGLVATTTFALLQSRVAREQAAEATAVRDFLVGIFRGADPRAGGRSIDARALVDRGSAALDAALATQPELAASFAKVLGNIYRQLAALDDAQAMLQRAIELTRARDSLVQRGLSLKRGPRFQRGLSLGRRSSWCAGPWARRASTRRRTS